jgi:hypothetical protein
LDGRQPEIERVDNQHSKAKTLPLAAFAGRFFLQRCSAKLKWSGSNL